MLKPNMIRADADSPIKKLAILGTYEGECADSNITNENGLDIPFEVWDTVFNSELYKRALDFGWYIGFLGHPEDPNCMDFEHACIVLTECHIDDNGKVYGKFNLVDTPVGRIVKAFQDAGVKFGISVRGAGDIIDNSVDPDTFVFRGFDLVTFPAFPESVPEFSEIAASSNLETQKKYKSVCAAVSKNIEGLNTVQSVDIVKSCFAKQSKEYRMLDERAQQLQSKDSSDVRIQALTQLYAETIQANADLRSKLDAAQSEGAHLRHELEVTAARSTRKVKRIEQILGSQVTELAAVSSKQRNRIRTITAASDKLKQQVESVKTDNLKYKRKINASTVSISDKDAEISDLRAKLAETVDDVKAANSQASNRDVVISKLKSDLATVTAALQAYQDGYAQLYATAIGAPLDNVTVTASTTVEELQQKIRAAVGPDQPEPEIDEEVVEDVDEIYSTDDDGLVTC